MANDSIQDILARANAILAGDTSTVKGKEAFKGVVPLRRMIFYTFLTDESTPHLKLNHYYMTDKLEAGSSSDWEFLWGPFSVNKTVLHGHSADIPCAAPHFCHQFGYKPKVTDNPAFVAMFNTTWRWFYGN